MATKLQFISALHTVNYDTTSAQTGEAWAARVGSMEIYAGFWHQPTATQFAKENPFMLHAGRQWAHAEWCVDIEGYRPWSWSGGVSLGEAALHMERAFKTEKAAREFFDYATWCIEQLSVQQMHEVMTETEGRMV